MRRVQQSISSAVVLSSASSIRGCSTAPSKPSTVKVGKGGDKSDNTKLHKLSENTSDASAVCEDVPFSTLNHYTYKLLHARRLWLPVISGAAAFSFLPPTLGTMELTAILTGFAVLQRMSVRGKVNGVTKDLTGKICVVTGGTSGLGLATVAQLLSMNATVSIVSRPGKEESTLRFLQSYAKVDPDLLRSRLSFVSVDLADQADVALAVSKLKKLFPSQIDILVNCAGIRSEDPKTTKQGIEEHVAINFLGPYHLTEGLLPLVRKASGRIVYVTCADHCGVRKGNVVSERLTIKPTPEEGQLTARCYTASKLGNIYHTQNLANRRYEGVDFQDKESKGKGVRPFTVCSVDPGVSSTNIDRATEPFLGRSSIAVTLRSLWAKDPFEGSQTIVNACLRDDLECGGHYAECTLMPGALSRIAQSPKEMEDVCRWAQMSVERYRSKNN